MIENKIQNLLCFALIISDSKHTDDYKEEICMRYLGFIPNNESLDKFIFFVIDHIDVRFIINKYEEHIGNILDIKSNTIINTHQVLLRHTKKLIDNMDKELLRDLKLRYVIQ